MDGSFRSAVRPLAFFLLLTCTGFVASAQEFRVETDVFVGDEPEPVSHTVTLFEKTAVYEFVDQPEQIIVYRKKDGAREGEFILLNPNAKKRTEVDVPRVQKLMGKLADWAAKQEDPVLKFAGDPKFEEKFDLESGDLTLEAKPWTYRTATVPAEDLPSLKRFRDFADHYAELTTMLYNSPPPGPRLALNAALEKHRVVPVEIRRTIDGDERHEVRAAHLFSWRLSRDDRNRLDQAQEYLASFEKVDNKQFLAAARGAKESVVRGQSE